MSVDFNNPYYPYQKIIAGNTLKGAEILPYKLLLYLMDLPDANGHIPFESNDNPRARLMRYLWYDDPLPLEKPLPTPEQKRSMLYDPTAPSANSDAEKQAHPKGYRLLWQRMTNNSEIEAKVILKCYINRLVERRKFVTSIGIRFEVWVDINLETNTRTSAFQRCFDIEQCLHEALDGVNFGGIGVCSFDTGSHTDNQSEALWTDAEYVGRSIQCSIAWSEGPENGEITEWGC